jgi:hypothetical protein
MNSRLSVLSLALLSMVSALTPGRVVAASSEPSAVRVRVVMVDARLRSAFIQRATGFDRSPPPATFAARQRELRDHFDAVLSLLVANTPRSLETALDRLEQRRGEDWSNDERVMWRQRLAEERLTNVRRLHRYQRRGLFPINQHVADRAAPVFVDNYDTACAVGHLMRESGWSEEVAAIQAENNLVYVTDVAEGPVVEWVATSGLTQEEAAIIQPAYPLDPAFFDGNLADLMNGGSITRGGLRYSEFDFSIRRPLFTPVPDLSQYYVAMRQGDYYGEGTIDPAFGDWFFMHVPAEFTGDSVTWLNFSYRVEVTRPGEFITAASLYNGGNYVFNRGVTSISTVVLSGIHSFEVLKLEDTNGFLYGKEDTASIGRTKQLLVSSDVIIPESGRFDGIVHSFLVVPEPAAIVLVALGSFWCLLTCRRSLLVRG